MSQKESIDVYVTLSPHRKNTSLHSWNKLFFTAPSNNEYRSKNAVLYHTRKKEDIENIIDLLESKYNKVLVIKLPEAISSDLQEYENEMFEKYLACFENYEPKRVFVSHTKIFPGVENTFANSVKMQQLLEEQINNEKLTVWSKEASEITTAISIFNHLILNYYVQIHYLISDPVEVDIQSYLFDDSLNYTVKRHCVHPIYSRPSVIQNNSMLSFLKKQSNEKKFDFVFGFTAYDEVRRNFLFALKPKLNINEKTKLYYCYFDEENKLVDNRLSYENYMNEISQARTTLVIPPYDSTTFSLHRFVESIYSGCIPIIFEADYLIGFSGYPEITKIIQQNLFIEDLDQLDSTIKIVNTKYEDLLNSILKSDFFTELDDKEFQQNKINVLFK